jgi:hypothetical protein
MPCTPLGCPQLPMHGDAPARFIQIKGNDMGTSSLGALAGMGLMAMLVILVVGVLVGALVLCVAFRIVLGYMPSYLRAIAVVVLTGVASFIVLIVVGMLLGGQGSSLLGVIIEVLIGALLVNYLLVSVDGSRIGFGKACLVQLVYIVIAFLIGLLIFALMAMMFGAAMFGMH